MHIKKSDRVEIQRIYLLIVLTAFCLSGLAQDEDDKHLLIGKVIHSDSSTVVPFAFIANSQTGFGKETHEDGVFKLNTAVDDTLFFRCLGYQDTLLVVNEQMLTDTLFWVVKEKTYELGSVDVLMFKSYASFRHMVANMDMIPSKDISMPVYVDIREVRKKKKEQEKTFGVGIGFGSGAKTRAERKYDLFAAREKRYERFREMTSRKNMQYLTKFDGAELDSFMVFLRTKHKINPELSDYKMMEAINLVFEEFLALKDDTTKVPKK
ncbi:MAG: carboxypeptidase-like regulatory domain-containing protein [Bacteroidales bacterium]|nr:carboxypeptidase-like regulatory domain-containing protein [Bacteroidales bacterium]